MKITRKRASVIHDILEEEIERRRRETKNIIDRPDRINGVPRTTHWERERKQAIDRLRQLPDLVEAAADALHVERTRGRPPALDPAQKTMLFLFARLTERSNRDIEALLSLLGPVFNVEVGYKERVIEFFTSVVSTCDVVELAVQ